MDDVRGDVSGQSHDTTPAAVIVKLVPLKAMKTFKDRACAISNNESTYSVTLNTQESFTAISLIYPRAVYIIKLLILKWVQNAK